ncbi:MAG: hypothetical protein JXN10_10170 [Clostridia bacterium]|nr:hypothetical protein [Clostridia bacterium]
MKVKRYYAPVICLILALMLCMPTACDTSPEIPAQVIEQDQESEPSDMPVQEIGQNQESEPAPVQSAVVGFTDKVLEAIVRATIGKPSGDIIAADVESLARLDLSNEYQRYISDETAIKDINGLEYFTSLEILDLSSHQVSDITPLRELHELTCLILDGNPIMDISPLSELLNLKLLVLSDCNAADYTPLANLINLQYLKLDNSTLSDITPLISLTNLTHLYLTGCSVINYLPLSDIYANLEQSDFTIANTLSELGFCRNSYQNQANFDGEEVSIRINHTEWGPLPDSRWMENCVRTVFEKEGYKVGAGYYPRQDAYIMTAHKNGEFVLNYTYDNKNKTFSFDNDTAQGNRENMEQIVRAIYSDVNSEDILLTPIKIYNDTISGMFGVNAAVLFEMPFDENDDSLPTTPYEEMGFTFYKDLAKCEYAKNTLNIQIHRSEWDKNASVELVDWNISFLDSNYNGYQLTILYFDTDEKYLIHLEKGGKEAWLNIYSNTGKKEFDPNGIDMFNDAFNTKDTEFIDKPLEYYESVLEDFFGMSSQELYALSLHQ